MKLFIWECVDGVTDRWHSEGGLAVVAESLERARELSVAHPATEPDATYELAGAPPEHVFVFPDAGCC